MGPPATVLVGEMTADGLLYRGRVGSGIGPKAGARLLPMLEPLARPAPPVDNPPRERAVWVEPTLVVDVDFTEWTSDGKLRQPSYKGIRDDLDPRALVRE